MAVRVLSQREMSITGEPDVAEVRAHVRDVAKVRKFDSFDIAALVTATSELTRNTWVHGGGGIVEIEELADEGRVGLRLRFVDHGPGIADVDRVLAGGYSTRRSLGLGVSGTRRLVDELHIDTRAGEGTTVTMTKWAR